MAHVVTLLFVGTAFATVTDIDRQVDKELSSINLFNKHNDDTTLSIPAGTINENVSYSNGYLTSWGTIYRTDHCFLYTSEENQVLSYDLHLGLKFFATLFGKIVINYSDTAAYYQVDDNSVHLGITYSNQTKCTVAIYVLQVERFEKVKFSVSNDEFNQFDFESFFQTEVHKKVNRILAAHTPIVQSYFQKGLCDNVSNGHVPPLRIILTFIKKLFTYF